MYKQILLSVLLFFCANMLEAQLVTTTKLNTALKTNYRLMNPLYNDPNCVMRYDPAQVDAKGAAFTFDFVNPGGDGYKGYPCGVVGGLKVGGTYYPGNPLECGMPVKLPNLTHDLRIRWKVSQANCYDSDDKWWATINVIFDGGTADSEPVDENREYDLVIVLKEFEQEDLSDKPIVVGEGAYWYFARNPDASLKTMDLNYNGVVYKYAVRYKFFSYNEGDKNFDKNTKVHVKFIPVDGVNYPPYLDHSLKLFVETSKSYIPYANLTPAEFDLANLKVANPDLYVKSISAGYEVYTGSFTINNDYFYTVIDHQAPAIPYNLTLNSSENKSVLDWDDCLDSDFDTYKVYRSEDGGDFVLLADNVLVSNYSDQSIVNGHDYRYYVRTMDRSFNLSGISEIMPDRVPPSIPLNLQCSQSSGSLFVDWDDVADSDLDSYSIYRAEGAGSFSLLTNRVLVSNYNDYSVEFDKEYHYYVVARDKSSNVSEESNHSSGLLENTSVVTGNNQLQTTMTIRILPSPTNDSFKLITPFSVKEIRLFDVRGMSVKTLQSGGEYKVGFLEDGLYILEIVAEDGEHYPQKLVLKH